ncbi:MAG TPA: hypothetical protein VN711_03050 [Candidatus Saccharimonadales bacterium]|nr:hypothetical protein [Candidatus Saccharimonadales bacterium]
MYGIDQQRLLTVIVEAGSFIAAFAAIAAGVVMAQLTKKFGTGILASGFKTNSWGVVFIALGIITDAASSYLIVSGNSSLLPEIVLITLLLAKEAFFVIGTYIIVIGNKKTGDKLESLMK